MVNFDLLNRARALATSIEDHNRAYYARGRSTISDFDYDRLVLELHELETQIGRPLDGSPTQRVGSDLDGAFAKVKHAAPMLSLENVFTVEKTLKWFSKEVAEFPNVEVVVEAKIDGCALELRYEGGLLVKAVTRGDGTTGDDVTTNVRAIRAVPLKLTEALDLRVRGEVYLRRSTFNALNAARAEAGEDLFANPRNAASGTLKSKSPADVAQRGLSFIAYAATLAPELTQQAMTAELMRLGFPTLLAAPLPPLQPEDYVGCTTGMEEPETTTPLLFSASLSDPADLESAIANISAQRDSVDFDTDGAVIKLNSRVLQTELGNKTKAPAWACAYKFPPERKATVLKDIVLTIGKTGQVTPNARLTPISLGGTCVEKASLMNADEMVRIGNPAPGDIVWVEKSAEIIPRVVGVKERRSLRPWLVADLSVPPIPVGDRNPLNDGLASELQPRPSAWVFPGGCDCGCSFTRVGVHFFCLNPACPERQYQRIKHATSKGALDWDGMGEAQVRHIIWRGQEIRQRGLLLSDLFTLDPAQLGLKTAALKKFLAERERVKSAPLWRKLVALGIEDIGQTLSKELAAKYGSLDAIIDAIVFWAEKVAAGEGDQFKDTIRDLAGPVALESLRTGLREQSEDIVTLTECGFIFADAERSNLPLAGQVFVITGTLTSGTRDSVVDRIEAKGGLVKGSVGRKTHFLVAGENPGGSKTEDAQKYGTPVITEEKLYEMLGEPMPKAGLPDLDAI